MTQLHDLLRQSSERTRQDMSRLPLAQARERRARGLAELRRIVRPRAHVPLRAVSEAQRTAEMLLAALGGRPR